MCCAHVVFSTPSTLFSRQGPCYYRAGWPCSILKKQSTGFHNYPTPALQAEVYSINTDNFCSRTTYWTWGGWADHTSAAGREKGLHHISSDIHRHSHTAPPTYIISNYRPTKKTHKYDLNPKHIKTQVHNKTGKALKCAIFSIYFTRIKNLLKASAYENTQHIYSSELCKLMPWAVMTYIHIRMGTHEHKLASADAVRMGRDQTVAADRCSWSFKQWNSAVLNEVCTVLTCKAS